jgi:Spy/CpxP family protein refolding chaperone
MVVFSLGELERLLRQTQADLVEARALTTKLEQQKMELNRNHAEKIIQFEKSHNEMRIKSRDAIETVWFT